MHKNDLNHAKELRMNLLCMNLGANLRKLRLTQLV